MIPPKRYTYIKIEPQLGIRSVKLRPAKLSLKISLGNTEILQLFKIEISHLII